MVSRAQRYLPRRDAELLDILYRRGRATAAEILADCTSPRSYSTVRTQLRVLECKGYIKRRMSRGRHTYAPTIAIQTARSRAFRDLAYTFFGGSLETAVAFALSSRSLRLTDAARERLVTVCTKASVDHFPARPVSASLSVA